MDEKIVMSLISLSGVIISVTLTFIINKFQNKLELVKIHNEYRGQLYSKRLEAYLDIYELVSGFVKIIKRNGILYDELNDFYEKYSLLDSKSGLLFSYTTVTSAGLMYEIKEILTRYNKVNTFSKETYKNIIRKLTDVELSMKNELGVFEYKNPSTIMENFKLSKTYKDVQAKININD